jgi:NNP family nitrate/nitrite transporter-like MFS transporter
LLRFTGQPQFCFMVLGLAAIACACGAVSIRFSASHKQQEQALYDAAILQRAAGSMAAA